MNPVNIWRKIIPERGRRRCKGPEVSVTGMFKGQLVVGVAEPGETEWEMRSQRQWVSLGA